MRLAIASALLLASPLGAQTGNWSEFESGTFARVVAAESRAVDATAAPAGSGIVSNLVLFGSRSYPQKVGVTFTGKRRDLTPVSKRVIETWAGSQRDSTFARRFTHEYLFREGDALWWVPVQTVLEDPLQQEVRIGGQVTLLTRLAGAERSGGKTTWIFVVNEFEAGGALMRPSQFELNGLLLGQNATAVETALGKPMREQRLDDGWVQRIYIVDRPHGAYMVAQSDSAHPDQVFSWQLAGRPGTVMFPFLGLKLGDSRARVDSLLGTPSKVTREQDLAIDLLEYRGTNYTVEVDSTGVLSSIQIYGYEGFASSPDSTNDDPLARFARLLQGLTTDSLLGILAADVEFYHDSSVVTWTRAPRAELNDTGSRMRSELAMLARAIAGRNAAMAIRMTEGGEVGRVYKYEEGPVKELFFVWRPGGHRLWEIRYR